MSKDIDLTNQIWFYDDRSKIKDILKLSSIIWSDNDYALGYVSKTKIGDELLEVEEPFLFCLKDGRVLNQDYDSWYATNDIIAFLRL